MRSVGQIDCDLSIFEEILYTPTDDEKDKLEKNYHGKLNNGRLEFEKPHWLIKEETETAKKNLKYKATNGKITNDDIADFIKNYL